MKYREIADFIRQEINAGNLPEGRRVFSVRYLHERFKTSTVLPKALVESFISYKYYVDLNTPLISQGALEIFMQNGLFRKH